MIPKIIHYCWFGRNPLPELALKCIESWKKYLPDYEIREWNEDNFDVNIIPYTAEAYQCKKYAFVSDYARFWILNKYGGLYFDTDVEVIKPMDDIISKGAFMGCEKMTDIQVIMNKCRYPAPGLGMGCEAGHPFLNEIIDIYKNIHFLGKDGQMNQKTIVAYTKEILLAKGLSDSKKMQHVYGFSIYPDDYFCPMDLEGVLKVTENTRSIHHYMASWNSDSKIKKTLNKIKKIIVKMMPDRIILMILQKKENHRNKIFNEHFISK